MHGPIDVKTVIDGGEIAEVTVLNHRESRVMGEAAWAAMPQRIVESQCVDVDCVTGATVTSMAIRDAVSKPSPTPAATHGTSTAIPPADLRTGR